MEFIERNHAASTECILCNISGSKNLEETHVLERGTLAYVVMNKFPYSNGHLMIVPNRHAGDWTELSIDEGQEIHRLTQKSLKALHAACRPEGFNIGVNLGHAAGAGIREHVHQHIVPRWVGDVNFMPLLGEVKVISEHLETTYQRIRKVWNNG